MYLERTSHSEGYKWVYVKSTKEVVLYSLSDVEQNPEVLNVPKGGLRPPQTKTLPNENVPTTSTQLGGINFDVNKAMPYIIGFVLLFVLFIAITNKASQ
jgi:hypothetical protein